jgi:hypothetical protein
MPVDFKVKWNVKINNKVYGSPEEMPPEVREAWEKARARPGELAVPGRITFNGKEYASAEEMPAEDRALYESVMKTLREKTEGVVVAKREALPSRRRREEEGPSAAVWVRRALIAAALLALAWMALAQLAGAPGR